MLVVVDVYYACTVDHGINTKQCEIVLNATTAEPLEIRSTGI